MFRGRVRAETGRAWAWAGAALVALAGAAGASAGADDPEGALAGKNLHPSGSTYVLRGEAEVKKAADAAQARLNAYRRAAEGDRLATRSAAEKKAYAAEVTKQRAALKQEMDQALPQLKAQIGALTQQQAAVRQQSSGLAYARGRTSSMARNQINGESNALGAQINALQAQANQYNAAYQEMGTQIAQLDPKPGSETARAQSAARGPSPAEAKDDYLEALKALRKAVDATKAEYEAVAEDAEVTAALAALDRASPRVKHGLGPTRHFLDTVKALEQAEARVASDTVIEPPRAAATPRRKAGRVLNKKK